MATTPDGKQMIVLRSEVQRSSAATSGVCAGRFAKGEYPQLLVAKGRRVELWVVPNNRMVKSQLKCFTIVKINAIQGTPFDAAIVLGHERFEIVDGDLTAMKTGLLQNVDVSRPPGVVASSGVVLIFWSSNLLLVSGESTSVEDVTSEFEGSSDDVVVDAALLDRFVAILCYSAEKRPADGRIYCLRLVGGAKIVPGPWCISHVPLCSKIVACAPSATAVLLLLTPFDATLYSAKTGSIMASLKTGWISPIVVDTRNCRLQSDVSNIKIAVLSQSSLDMITFSTVCGYGDKSQRLSLHSSQHQSLSKCDRMGGFYRDLVWLEDDAYCFIHSSGEALMCRHNRREADDGLLVVCDTKPRAVDVAALSGSTVLGTREQHRRLPEVVVLSTSSISIVQPQCLPISRCSDETTTRLGVDCSNASLQVVAVDSRKWIVVVSKRTKQQTCCYHVSLNHHAELTTKTSTSQVDSLSRELNSTTMVAVGGVANMRAAIVRVTRDDVAILTLDAPHQIACEMTAFDVIREPNATHLFADFDHGKYVLVASSKKIALIRIDGDLRFTLVCRKKASGEVAAISLQSRRQQARDSPEKNGVVVGVATWDGQIDVFRLSHNSDLSLIYTVPTCLECVLVRSLAFQDDPTADVPTVFAGFADGHVAASHGSACQLFRVGSAPVSLKPMSGDVLVCGVHESAVIHADLRASGDSTRFRVFPLPHRNRLTPLVVSGGSDTAVADLVAWLGDDGELSTGTLGCCVDSDTRASKFQRGRAKHVMMCSDTQLIVVSVSLDDSQAGEVSEILVVYSSVTLEEVGQRPLGVEIVAMCIAPPAPLVATATDVLQTFAIITSMPGDTLERRATEYHREESRRAVVGGPTRCALTMCEITKTCQSSYDILPSSSMILQGNCACATSVLESTRIAVATGSSVSIVKWCARESDDHVEENGEHIVSFELGIVAKASMPTGEDVVALASFGHYLAAAERYHSVCVFVFDGKLLSMVAIDVSQGRLISSLAFIPEDEGNDAQTSLPCLVLSEREKCRVAVLVPSQEECQILCTDDAIRGEENEPPPSPQEDENHQCCTPCRRVKPKLVVLREIKAWKGDVVKFVTQTEGESGILFAVYADGSLEQLCIFRGNTASRLEEIAKSVGIVEGCSRAESCELPVVHSRALHKYLRSRGHDEPLDIADKFDKLRGSPERK